MAGNALFAFAGILGGIIIFTCVGVLAGRKLMHGHVAEGHNDVLVPIKQQANALGAPALVGLQLVQSQFQWNQRTSLLATAVKQG